MGNQELATHRYTAWQLIRLYWQSSERVSAYALFGLALGLSIFLVAMDVIFTTWYNYFYDALQEYNKHAIIALFKIFLFLATLYIVLAVYRFYIQQYLSLRWRKWLTNQFLDRWLTQRSYYYLEQFNNQTTNQQTDNPDQRIQEDINSLVVSSLGLVLDLISAITTIFAFVFVLWHLSGDIHVSLGSFGTLKIPGYLVWVGLLYSAIGTWLTFKIGRPLVFLNFEQQRREANFRFGAIDIRSHAEQIALYQGEIQQKNYLKMLLSGVLNNWYAIILRQKLLLWFTAGYNQIAILLPLIVALPNYLNKVFKLGGLMQALTAFGHIQNSFSFLVNSYTTIAEWQAILRRLLTFLNQMSAIEEQTKKGNKFIFSFTEENIIYLKNGIIYTPQGDLLLKKMDLVLTHGVHYVIKGASGLGKSTLIRVLAGIWPYGEGTISLPENKKIIFLPQVSYMPIGSLRDALLFPDTARVINITDEKLIYFLKQCDLVNLIPLLQSNAVTCWSSKLSPGELQRIAFIRILIQQPNWVFLDESTSALDIQHEKALYILLKTQLPDCSIVSVGHRVSIDMYHEKEIDLTGYASRLE